jgi:hypothetical protein
MLYTLCFFFCLQNAVSFIMLTCLVPVLFTFYIQVVLKFKKNNSGAKGLILFTVLSRKQKNFRARPDRPWDPPSLLCNGYRVFHGDKAAGAWCWPPTSSSAEVKERVELYLYSPSGLSWPVIGWTLPLPNNVLLGVCLNPALKSRPLFSQKLQNCSPNANRQRDLWGFI